MAAATAPGLRCAMEQGNAGVDSHGSVVAALSVPRCCAGDAVATQDRRFGLLCAMSRYRPKPDEHSEKPGT